MPSIVSYKPFAHILMMMLQGKSAFTRNELDSIADNLATDEAGGRSALNPFALVLKPHRNVITGNYDANVLIAALNSRGKDVVWFDRRKGINGLFLEVAGYGDRLLGIIANVPKPWLLGWWQGRHWVAICKLEGTWYNLDSNKAVPVAFVDEEMDLREFFETLLANDSEIMLILNEVAGAATQGKG